jgi:proteasome lid subunit RPN8/RPN11
MSWEEEIIRHAEETPSVEVCGLVIRTPDGLLALRCPNASPTPSRSFIIELSHYRRHLIDGTLHAVYHSHTVSDENPSEGDIYIAEKSQIPGYVYSLATKKFSRYEPSGYKVPLTGRPFVFGVFDCVSLVDDYYFENFGARFPHYERKLEEMRDGIPFIKQMMLERNLIEVDKEDIQVHDILGFSYHSLNGMCNHVGVCNEKGMLLHQLLNRVSVSVVYGGMWQKLCVFVARRK